MDYDELSDDQLSDVWQYNLFPNAILSFTPEHCWILRPRPHPTDPSRCEFDKISLVRFAGPETATSKDAVLLAGVQKGMSSQGFGDVFLNEDEMRVQHFHNEMDRLIS